MPEATPIVRRRALIHADLGLPFAEMASPYAAEVLGWDELRSAMRNAAPSSVVVVRPFTDDSAVPDPRVRDLVAAAPLVPVVALVPFRVSYTQGARILLLWGVSELADAELEAHPAAIRQRLLDSHAQPFKARVEQHLSRFVSQSGVTLIRAASAVVVDGGTAGDLAVAIGSSDRTVPGWCVREGLPAPRRLLAWMRALLAVALLEDPNRTVLQVARGAGYASDTPLRRAFREVLGDTGVPPRERTFPAAMALFNAELEELRRRARRKLRNTNVA